MPQAETERRDSVFQSILRLEGQAHAASRHVEILRQRMADDLGLLIDLLRHEMAVVALLDQEGAGGDALRAALHRQVGLVVEGRALAVEDDPVALLEIGDEIGEGRERERIRAEIHLAIADADRERRALAGADQQIVLALEQEGEREGAAQPRQAQPHGLDRRAGRDRSRG